MLENKNEQDTSMDDQEPIYLRWEDLNRLRNIIVQTPPFAFGSVAERMMFLLRAGWPQPVINNNFWNTSSEDAVTQLLNAANRLGYLAEGRRGYTALGMILAHLIEGVYIGLRDGLYIAELISRYKLINTDIAEVSPVLKDLLSDVADR